uniref:Uncharacterized protein n=1 Tax=Monopterus albus TaxID=43700 RepID=A0A3Q3JA69_MONAL
PTAETRWPICPTSPRSPGIPGVPLIPGMPFCPAGPLSPGYLMGTGGGPWLPGNPRTPMAHFEEFCPDKNSKRKVPSL